MVMPPVRPLSPEAWSELQAALERGPTPEQIRIAKEARERARHMRVEDAGTMKMKMRRIDIPPSLLDKDALDAGRMRIKNPSARR